MMELKSDLIRGTLLGLIILGIGGRLVMRVVAHMEGRVPVFTPEGSIAVVFYGTVAGALSGLIYYLLRRFVSSPWVRTAAFIAICELISWRGVSGLLAVPQAMFMALALVYLVLVDLLGRRSGRARAKPENQVQPAF
jgi:hypothetical protein